MAGGVEAIAAPHAASRTPLLHWMIFTGVSVFALVLLWHFGLIAQMISADRTRISLIIMLLYAGAALHCLWRTVLVAREGDAARQAGRLLSAGGARIAVAGDAVEVTGSGTLPQGLVAAHIRDLAVKAGLQGGRRLDQTLLLNRLAARPAARP